jgi:hypothetical protein
VDAAPSPVLVGRHLNHHLSGNLSRQVICHGCLWGEKSILPTHGLADYITLNFGEVTLERQAASQLKGAGIIHRRYLAELRSVAEVVIHAGEFRVVEGVEGFRAEFKLRSFPP